MDDIIDFYTQHPDEERLSQGWGMLEFARSKDIVLRHLPKGSRTVLDVGGGTGVYTEWLGDLGYEAHLIDITPSHIEFARSNRMCVASAQVGDARSLSWQDSSADAVLLFGPMYHLVERSDRARALGEARRVLRPGGMVFVAAVCRFAPLITSLLEGFFDDPAFYSVLMQDLDNGQHRNTTGDARRFTTAYFHRPEQLVDEVQAAGFQLVDFVPVEGPCWLAMGSRTAFSTCWSDPRRRAKLLDLALAVEHDPMALALSPHLIAVGRA
jgi:ubiquinone/menaquinone biosynthesis C-methylase UbiE